MATASHCLRVSDTWDFVRCLGFIEIVKGWEFCRVLFFCLCCNLGSVWKVLGVWGACGGRFGEFGGFGFFWGVLGGLKGRREHLSGLSFPVQGLFWCPESHAFCLTFSCAVKDEGLLHELLVMKRVQFLFILALRVWGLGLGVWALGFGVQVFGATTPNSPTNRP